MAPICLQPLYTESSLELYLERSRSAHTESAPICVIIKGSADFNGSYSIQTLAFSRLIETTSRIYKVYFLVINNKAIDSELSKLPIKKKINTLFFLCHGTDHALDPGLHFSIKRGGILRPRDISKLDLQTHIVEDARIYIIACQAEKAIVPAFQKALPKARIYGSIYNIQSPGYFFFPEKRLPLVLAQEAPDKKVILSPTYPYKSSLINCVTKIAHIPAVKLWMLLQNPLPHSHKLRAQFMPYAIHGDMFAQRAIGLSMPPPKALYWLKTAFRKGARPYIVANALIQNKEYEQAQRYVIEMVTSGDLPNYWQLSILGHSLPPETLLQFARRANPYAIIAYLHHLISHPEDSFDAIEVAEFFISTAIDGYPYSIRTLSNILKLIDITPYLEQIKRIAPHEEWAQFCIDSLPEKKRAKPDN